MTDEEIRTLISQVITSICKLEERVSKLEEKEGEK